MKKVITNKNEIEERADKILTALLNSFNELIALENADSGDISKLDEKIYMQKLKRAQLKLKAVFSDVCGTAKPLDYETVGAITEEQLTRVIGAFKRLIARIMEHVTFIPSKQNFCEFTGITVGQYDYLLGKQENGRQSAVSLAMEGIDGYLFDMTVSGAEQGAQKERSTIYRTKAKRQGLGVSEVKNEQPNVFIFGAANSLLDLKPADAFLAALPGGKK
jgi:hypothetical protein